MNKFLKFLFCLPLGITLLAGCNKVQKVDFANNSFRDIYFQFYDRRGREQQTFLFEAPVIDVINLSQDEFFNEYLPTKVDTSRYDYYTFRKATLSESNSWGYGVDFEFDSIRHLINMIFEDQTYDSYERLDCNFFLTFDPTQYTITFLGVEGLDTRTYTVETGGENLPYVGLKVNHRILDGWVIQGTDTMITKYPTDSPRNLTVEPCFHDIEFNITYSFPYGFIPTNPGNPKKYTYFDDPITLINYPNHPDGAYTFDGFYLNDEKITTIDTHLEKNIEIDCRFTFKQYTAKYYVGDELIDTKTFTYRTMRELQPPAVPQKDHLTNGRWDTRVTECRDYEIHAVYDKVVYNITYNYPFEGVSNPNITSFTAFDGKVDLIPLADSTKGYYTFDGFYLNGTKIEKLDTSIGKNITIEVRFNLTEYKVNYYDGETKLFTDTFTFLTFKDYVQRDVPEKDHYQDGKWSETVTEIKDYDIYVSYKPKKYTVTIVSSIDGDDVNNNFTVTYGDGTTYSDLCDTLSFTYKYFIGLYSDRSYSKAVTLSSSPDKDITLYAKWGSVVFIESASDWDEIVKNPSGQFILSNNISFTMDQIPVVSNFTGILNGNGHKIQRFSNSKTDCDTNYGLFKTNSGTIKNLIIEDASFVSKNADYSDTVYSGLLCGTNKGTIENIEFVSVVGNITANYYVNVENFSDYYGHCYVGLCCGNNQGVISNCSISEDSQLNAKARIGYYRSVGYGSKDYIMYGYFYYGLLAGLNTGTISNITSSGSLLVNGISMSESKKGWSYELMDGVRYLTRSGGIVGRNGNGSNKGSVINSMSEVTITVDYGDPTHETDFSAENRVGGIVGTSEANIENCYTSSKASLINKRKGDLEMGGIVGRQESTGKVKGCYTECKYSSDNSSGYIRIGGIAGCNCGTLSYCHATMLDVVIAGSNNRVGGIGTLVGYSNDTSTIMFCIGFINIVDEITIATCYDIGNVTSNAILNKVSIYAPDQTNTINVNDRITNVDLEEELIQAAKSYYFDEAGFTLHNNKLPTLEGIGKQN